MNKPNNYLKIQLNSQTAVDKLIDGDEKIEIEVKDAIVKNILKRVSTTVDQGLVESCESFVVNKYFTRSYGGDWKLKDKDHKAVIEKFCATAMETAAHTIAKQELKKFDFEARVAELIPLYIDHEVNRLVKEKFAAAIAGVMV